MTIIPQDPVLLKGTIRFNVDPMMAYQDQEVIEALTKAQVWGSLSNHIMSSHNKNGENEETNIEKKVLELEVEANGSNLSVGQRQLVCIARALVVKPKILLMDEATANIDEQTDGIIQHVIHEEFMNSTVVTIAHRLNTIIKYDKLIVMENGERVEEGTPWGLLNKESYFRMLVKENGNEFFEEMMTIAKEKQIEKEL